MQTITDYLSLDHKFCDELFFTAKTFVENDNWQQAKEKFEKFFSTMNRHIDVEEKILFPAFEKAIGTPNGPTRVMCSEHIEIRKSLDNIQVAITNHDKDKFLLETQLFLNILQPHSAKEEQILYPMCDDNLSEEMDDLITKMKQYRQK